MYTDSSSSEPTIDSNALITVTSDADRLADYKDNGLSAAITPSLPIEHVPQVRIITPIKRAANKDELDLVPDDYYFKRHRRHELEEKKQKNREKERLRHGYYQQNQLVERIKMMDKSSLQSIVSSIRHRNKDAKETEEEMEDEETYLEILHERLLRDAIELLNRYEALGLSKTTTTIGIEALEDPTPEKVEVNPEFHEAVKTEAIRQKSRQLTTFNKHPQPTKSSSRRSTRHVTAFGVKLPEFLYADYELPAEILNHRLMNTNSGQ
ncbi:hypothetical protein G6F46_011803 [Rhizopus delemar]|uniref:Something about silencing protein 4 domain-containing protein n=3 Tax=Rhizopus TaxID=4842 RepID=I1BNT9_RHIO9|nr:hypothetical protein RO3G_02573 [Rhizopus delemar RA 99-880]KAG1446567.1 hypothetical protein G6F55_011491 [Rhizopus delemar]KAG1534734.1 hypothetical protein G6F51_011927 [Rhizopus arrhizus]KAG1489144.1 hypothetical protein G6F54_011646 [Rhizopus delemar]KAG1498541.1 hypothetical protein G6F53_011720 [Rhizopus delemar]|eukprot:EIE77869.1 hypothetical protein RO3G_02573 [Rhizopus delemar RA 99-880]